MSAEVVNLDDWREGRPETLLEQAIGMAYCLGADIERHEGREAVLEKYEETRDMVVRNYGSRTTAAQD